jgi:hypothetical protein
MLGLTAIYCLEEYVTSNYLIRYALDCGSELLVSEAWEAWLAHLLNSASRILLSRPEEHTECSPSRRLSPPSTVALSQLRGVISIHMF